MATAGDVETLVQALLSDVSQDTYTDAVLLPFMASNYRKLQRRLRSHGIGTMRAKSDVAMAAASTSVTKPGDLIAPIRIWEKVTGETDDAYVPMTQVSTLPNKVQDGGSAIYWAWEDDTIKLIGSSVATTYRLEYEQILDDLTGSASALLIAGCRDALAYMTAADAARSRGVDKLAAWLKEESEILINDLIRNQVKVQQGMPFRQAGYGKRYR